MRGSTHGTGGEHFGERNSAILLEDLSDGVGTLAAESRVERGAADCRGVFLHLQDVRRDSLRLLCQLQDLCLVRAVDGGFAVGKVDGGLAQEGLVRRKIVMRRAEYFRDPARHSLHIAVTSVADQ
jgi:hypothetical protein